MNNGTFCSPGGSGLSGHARARYTQDHFDKMNDGSFNHGGFQAQQAQMTGPGFSGPASGYRSQFQDQIQSQEIGLASSSDDERGPGRPAPSFDGSEFLSNSQYQGHSLYTQHPRCYQSSATNKSSHAIHPLHPMAANSVGPVANINQIHSSNFPSQRMHLGPGQSFPVQQMVMTPTLNHMLQSSSSSMNQKSSSSMPINSPSIRDECISTSSHQSRPEMVSPSHSSYSMPNQPQQQGWGSQSRAGGHHYLYPQGPGSSPYRCQSGGNDMSQGRRPAMGAMGGSYPQQGGQYMNQQMPMGPGAGPQQRFMMGGPMPNQMYGHSSSQPQMYMPSSQQPPGPPVSPAARPPTPQLSQQMQNMVQNSPTQPSPVPSVSSEHGSTQSAKHGDDVQDMIMDINNPEDLSGENSRGSAGILRPVPSPVGSAGSRSNTPASIPGAQAGSPMPVRPPSSQIDGQNRMTQSPMATQGYNQHMMPPPNSMGYMPNAGKMPGNQMPGHYPQYSSQYPQGSYGRQQPNMGGMSGPQMSGPMQSYPGSQPNMYPNGPGQMPGAPMYGNMPGVVRNMGQQGYGPNPGPYSQGNMNMGGMMNNQYAGYNSHIGPMPGQHSIQQAPGVPCPVPPNMTGQQGGLTLQQHSSSSNKAAQAAQAAMIAAASSVGPRMSHNRGSMSPSRGMFGQSGGGPLAQMNNMTNSPNLGSPSLNSMSNAVEQLARSSSSGMSASYMGNVSTSAPSPVPKSAYSPAAMNNSNTSSSIAHSGDHVNQTSPISSSETHESLSRPSSTTAHHPDLPNNESTMGSDSSGGMPSDSTSVDSGFHSSDQGDKTSDSISNLTQSGSSPPLLGLPPNGDVSRTLENISPPGHPSHHHQHVLQMHMQHEQQHYHMGPESKMPYSNDGGVPLPPSAMSSMPSSSSSVVTTANAGPLLTSVTQSIASPVTSVSTSAPHHYPHPHPHHMGPIGGPPHMMSHSMGPGPHGLMPNGMSPSGMMTSGLIGGPNQMPQNMGGPPHMMPPNMGGPNMNMSQNGPMMGPNRPLMGHSGPMMSGHPGINSGTNNIGMPHMSHMSSQQQQMNCMPHLGNNSGSNSAPSDEPPEKKKKTKEFEGQGGPCAGSAGSHYSEEPTSPGALKSTSDLSKLFEMGPEPDRRQFLERILTFLEESGQPVTALPVISKTPLDLYKLYFCVREKGGFEEVTRSKKWRDVCTVVNIGTSASAAFTLKKNYIRYLFNYECKYDRGGINPAPILAQMEAQLAHKREQKSKRAPSPAGSNSNESFRPPSVPNNQVDSSYQPPNMPPPYMQNPDGNMPNSLMGGNMIMGPNSMMGPGPNSGMGSMMGGPPGMGPSGMMGGPNPNMMHGQQGMMPQNAGAGNMMGPHMMSGGPPGYGGPMMQHPGGPMSQPPSSSTGGPPIPPHSNVSTTGPAPVTSDSISLQDPFADESGYLQQRGGPLQPAISPQLMSVATSTAMASGYPGMQQSSMGSATMTSTSSRPVSSSAGYGGPDHQMGGFPASTSRTNEPSPASGDQFPFGQQFERPDRFDQSSPNMGIRPPVPAPGMTPSQQSSQQTGENNTQMFPGPRFSGPHPSMGMRPQQGADTPTQYPQQGPVYQGQPGYPGPQYTNYSQTSTGPYPGPRPPAGPGGIYGTPTKRFPEEHAAQNQFSDWANSGMGSHMNYSSAPPERQAPSPDDRLRDGGQWSPMQRPRMSQSGPGYMSPAPPSTPPMGPYSRQISHRSSPQSREVPRIPGQKTLPTYGGLQAAALTKKELVFPPDSVESVSISTTKRKKLTSKDIAPFEPWRLMLSLKSGLLAESTWALDTLNILLYDDNTYGYFGLNTLPGLLEILTEHLRHCLMQMFKEFEDLEGLSQKHKVQKGLRFKSVKEDIESEEKEFEIKKEKLTFSLTGPNYTMTSRKGLPVKIDQNPTDSSVLELKEWDVYSGFDTSPDYWSTGHGNITDHILTHLESDNTNKYLSGRFRRKRTRKVDDDIITDGVSYSQEKKKCTVENVPLKEASHCESTQYMDVCQREVKVIEQCEKSVSLVNENTGKVDCGVKADLVSHEPVIEISNLETNHSNLCNGDKVCEGKNSPISDVVHIKSEQLGVIESDVQKHTDDKEKQLKSKVSEKDEKDVDSCKVEEIIKENVNFTCDEKHDKVVDGVDRREPFEKAIENIDNSKPFENGDIEEPKLSPMVNHIGSDHSPFIALVLNTAAEFSQKVDDVENDNCSNSSPPVLKAECLDSDEDVMAGGSSEPMNSTMNTSCTEATMEANTSVVVDISAANENKKPEIKDGETLVDGVEVKTRSEQVLNDSTEVSKISEVDETMAAVNESCASETEELSASIVTELLKQDENLEEEAFQRDDPPLCVTPESRDELGRRCVCISNIIRSLSCVPGNEARICRHAGILRVLGRLLLLHHNHPIKPPPRKLPCGDEEDEREEPPRVYDDEHWWWDYLDQLRENTLVTLANICGHLKLGNFSEQVCYPLLEGLLHWVICPASVARDPLPTLPSGSVLSPQRLVLEALCKLCIHEINVDLLLATRPVKRLLELFSVLVHLLADRNHQITREFSLVLLSLLVTGESSAARAVALQHPSVSLLVDFLEIAEQNALAIANQQGLEVLQSNPEVMGTSLDMLRRAATILLHMAHVPDNRKMFLRQQSRLLNLVMSQILDQSVSNTLSEVLYECSQFS